MGKYRDELTKAMTWLGEKEDTFFLGQSCAEEGTAMYGTLQNVSLEKRLELPVIENSQLGISIGMSLNGTIPVSIFPRWNFLLCATDQLVNHLDKIKQYSHDEFIPKVIIRTSVGAERPLHPQSQHVGNFSKAFRHMLTNVEIIELHEPEDIFLAYKKAYERGDGKSTILVEFGDYHNEK